jgi:hypothetical protein
MVINKAISEYVSGFLKINYSNEPSEKIFFADKILTAMDAREKRNERVKS